VFSGGAFTDSVELARLSGQMICEDSNRGDVKDISEFQARGNVVNLYVEGKDLGRRVLFHLIILN